MAWHLGAIAATILSSIIAVSNAITIGCPTNALPFVTGATTKLNFPPPYNLSPIGGTVLYICDSGYELVGTANVTCLPQSRWSRSPLCIKKKNPIDGRIPEGGNAEDTLSMQLLYQSKAYSQINPALLVRDSMNSGPSPKIETEKENKKVSDEYFLIPQSNQLTNTRVLPSKSHAKASGDELGSMRQSNPKNANNLIFESSIQNFPGFFNRQVPSSHSICPPAPKIDYADVSSTTIWPGATAKEGDTVDYKCFRGFVDQHRFGSLLRMTCVTGGVWRSEFDINDKQSLCIPMQSAPWAKLESNPSMYLPKPLKEVGPAQEGEIILVPPPTNTRGVESDDEPPMLLRKPEATNVVLPKPVKGVAFEDILSSLQKTGKMDNAFKSAGGDMPQLIDQIKSLIEETKNLPSKKLVTCGPAPEIVSANIIGTSFENRTSKPSDWVQYSCQRGLNMVGDAYVICMRDGRWSTIDGSLPLCISERSCPEPAVIPSTVIEPLNNTQEYEYARRVGLYTPGTHLRYKCSPSDSMFADGNGEIECGKDGSWTPVTFQCIPSLKRDFCPPPPRIRGGFPVSHSGLHISATATYVCESGYRLVTKATASCNRAGHWSPVPICATLKHRSADRTSSTTTKATTTTSS